MKGGHCTHNTWGEEAQGLSLAPFPNSRCPCKNEKKGHLPWAETACAGAQGSAGGVWDGFSQKPLCSAQPAQPPMAILPPEHQITWPTCQPQGEKCSSLLSSCPSSCKGDGPGKANDLLLCSPVRWRGKWNLGTRDSGRADADGRDLGGAVENYQKPAPAHCLGSMYLIHTGHHEADEFWRLKMAEGHGMGATTPSKAPPCSTMI